MGYAFGLRVVHWNANRWVGEDHTRVCYGCHPDSTPAWTPASEWLSPPYYSSPGTGHPSIPGSPCNQQPQDEENVSGGPQGLDNDGDGLFDMNDPDCAPGPAMAPTEEGEIGITPFIRGRRSRATPADHSRI
jgi:hypothetical protein